jgi:hypothetical protein
MKLNHEYLKTLVLNIENIPFSRPHLEMIFESIGIDDLNEDFLLHYEVLHDNNFIIGAGNADDIGLVEHDGGVDWSNSQIRLTAKGHEFAAAMRQEEVWVIIKDNFKEASVETIFSIGKDIVKNIAKKKLDLLLE